MRGLIFGSGYFTKDSGREHYTSIVPGIRVRNDSDTDNKPVFYIGISETPMYIDAYECTFTGADVHIPGTLHVTTINSSRNDLPIFISNNLSLGTNTITCGPITSSGTITGTTLIANSSKDKKQDINSYDENACKLLKRIKVVKFKYKPEYDDKQLQHYGFIAEDTPIEFTGDNKHMDYTNCIGILIKAVQELTDKVELLEEKINGK